MTGEELGTILGDTISELENASMDIDEAINQLLDIDGKVILLSGDDDDIAADQPRITIAELGEILGNAMSMLETVTMDIEDAKSLLHSIDGNALTADEPDESEE